MPDFVFKVSVEQEQTNLVGYVSIERIAQDVGVSVRIVRGWREKGLPAIGVGRHPYLDPKAVRRWLESHA